MAPEQDTNLNPFSRRVSRTHMVTPASRVSLSSLFGALPLAGDAWAVISEHDGERLDMWCRLLS